MTKNFGKESFKKGFLASATQSTFAVGTMVELHSLSATSLNGRRGKCGAFNKTEGRYAVTLLKTKTKKRKKVLVRPTNLRRAPDADVIRPQKQPEKYLTSVFACVHAKHLHYATVSRYRFFVCVCCGSAAYCRCARDFIAIVCMCVVGIHSSSKRCKRSKRACTEPSDVFGSTSLMTSITH